MGLAFAGSGDLDALNLLAPLVAQGREDALQSIAYIGRDSAAEERAVVLVNQQMPARVPGGNEGRGYSFEGRSGIWVMSWLLRGRVRKALAEMQFILTRSKPNETWRRWASRNTAIWCLPDAFLGTGEEGVEAARALLGAEGHPAQPTGLLALGLAGRGSCVGRICSRNWSRT